MSDPRSIGEQIRLIQSRNSTNSSSSNNNNLAVNVPAPAPGPADWFTLNFEPIQPAVSNERIRQIIDGGNPRPSFSPVLVSDYAGFGQNNNSAARPTGLTITGTRIPERRLSQSLQAQDSNNDIGLITNGIPNRQTGADKYHHCIEYHWAIEEFGKFLTTPDPDPNFRIRSPKFDGDGISKFKWGLSLNPGYMTEDGEKWISIFINLFNSSGDSLSESNNQNQFVEATVEIGLEIDGNLINCKIDTRMFECQMRRGWSKFSKTPTQIQNEQIVVHCKVWLGCASIKHENLAPKVEPAGQNLGKIQTDFASILKSGKFSDAQIDVGSEVFQVHKSVLASRSEYFMGYFEARDNGDPSKIVVQDFSKEIVEKMLEYMYTGKTEIIEDNVKELWQVGNKYSVVDLKNDCENVLVKSLKVDTCIKVLLFSDFVGASLVKSKAIEYIINNKSEVSESSDFKEMLDSNHKLCSDILKSDFIAVGVKRLKVSHSSN